MPFEKKKNPTKQRAGEIGMERRWSASSTDGSTSGLLGRMRVGVRVHGLAGSAVRHATAVQVIKSCEVLIV